MAAVRSPIRVVGRYALYNEIAAGGMATIHLGRLLGPVGFARTVAIKRLHPQYAKDPEFVSMFLDEARLAARVQHPNVVATIDVVATDGELFLIMDYVRGESLSKLIRGLRKRGERVPPRIAAAILCGFLHGLHAAHEAKNERGEPLKLVHRDVSPQNVLVGADGIARVLDFGVAKAQGRIQVTRDGQIKGKLAYMPPEQLTGREVSRAVDIYAGAVVMWETLTGERLFKGDTEAATLAKILREDVAAPTAVVPTLPPAFDAPLLRALSRDPAKRHATAKELALELERCCGVASPTEVGEWVESVVGHVLDAREQEIAEIESSSAGMTLSPSGRPAFPTSDTDSNGSLPSARAILEASRQGDDTVLMGSVPGLPATSPVEAILSGSELVTSPSHATVPALGLVEEPSQSRSGTQTTGTRFTLPIERRLPVMAAIGGVIVLLVIGALALGGRSSRTSEADAGPVSTFGTSAPKAAREEVPPPPPPEAPPPEPAAPEDPKPSVDAPAAKPVAAKPPAPPAPKATTRPSAPAPVAAPRKGSCDPPYTIDASGRKKYKLECL